PVPGELGEEVGVARHERRLRDRGDGVPELREHLQAAARDAEPALDRLIAVRVARERDDLRLPARRGERLSEELGRVLLHHDPPLEVEPGAEAEVLVARAGVTIVRGEPRGVERSRRGLDVDDVGQRTRLDGPDRLRVEVHLAPEEPMQLARYGRPAHGEEADAVREPTDQSQCARLAGTQLQLKVESERERIPADAVENREIDLGDAPRVPAVALGIEEARKEPAAVASGVALGGDEGVND